MPICTTCGCYSSGICKICPKPEKEKKVYRLKKVPVKKRSLKREVEQGIYLKLRAKFLKDNPTCAVYAHLKSEDVHHKKKRGINFLKVETWLAVSREAHDKIERNPVWAYQQGYSEKVNSKQTV